MILTFTPEGFFGEEALQPRDRRFVQRGGRIKKMGDREVVGQGLGCNSGFRSRSDAQTKRNIPGR